AGTLQCCETALDNGFCFYLGGGSHHAQKDFGAGFCVLNDVVLSLRILQHKGKIKSAWVIDVDAHKGDGTSALTYSDPSIRTLSIHMAKGWPLDREESMFPLSFIPSDIEIPVEEGEDNLYNEKLKEGLESLSLFGSPDIALVVSGTDPYEKDELKSSSGINLTLEQMMERDRLVYNFLKDRNIPSAYIMSGGYGKECWIVYAKFLEWVLGKSYK
ncbi:MAG TPA: histone deacetylase, partial [Clostridia bacterium]